MGMTRQQVFDHLITYYAIHPAGQHNGLCRYLTGAGAKCAVGSLIPEDHPASSTLTRGLPKDLFAVFPDLISIFDIMDPIYRSEGWKREGVRSMPDIWRRIQMLHDQTLARIEHTSERPADWGDFPAKLAEFLGLEFDPSTLPERKAAA